MRPHDAAQVINSFLSQLPASAVQEILLRAAETAETDDMQEILLKMSRHPLHTQDRMHEMVSMYLSFVPFDDPLHNARGIGAEYAEEEEYV